MTKAAGFTRTEVAIVAVVLLLAIATAGPILWNLYERQTRAECVMNLKQLHGAALGWALENKRTSTDTYSFADFAHYLKGSVVPVCPRGGTYTPGRTVADPPHCSFHGHTF